MRKEDYHIWKYGPVQARGFNPDYNPNWKQIREQTTASMEEDGYYDTHTREECAAEWKRRYEEISKKFEKNT